MYHYCFCFWLWVWRTGQIFRKESWMWQGEQKGKIGVHRDQLGLHWSQLWWSGDTLRETGAQELQKMKVWWELKQLWLGLVLSQANRVNQQQICNDICELQHQLVLHCPLSLKTTWLPLPFVFQAPSNVPCGPWGLEKQSWKLGPSSAQLTQCRYVYNE